jgi:high affinity sulfate transporter 1
VEALLMTTDMSNTTEVQGDVMNALQQKKLEVAGAITLLCGIIFIILGKLGLGMVTVFMSDAMVTGVTVGAAFHVGSSQLKTMFGLTSLPRYKGVFKLMKLWWGILSNIHHSNPASIIGATICILIIYLVKRFVNDKYKNKLRVPVPIELIVVIIATIITYYASLYEKFGVGIVKDVPVGIPTPHFPDLSLGVDYLMDGLIIIIVAFAQTVSVAKLMGLKHNYSVDSNQEMFALGMVNLVCALFSGYIPGASVSRTMVQDSAGGRTQVASLFAAALVLLVMLFMGPYFYYVPKIAFSAIIIVSLQSLMLKLLTIREQWRKSKVDCTVFTLTVLATVVLDADLGLLVGVVISIFLILFQSMRCSVDVDTHITLDGGGSFWKSADKYYSNTAGTDTGVKVIRINFPLYFVNAEIVTNTIFKKTGLDPLTTGKTMTLEVKTNSCFSGQKKGDKQQDNVNTKGNEGEPVADGTSSAVINKVCTPDVEAGSAVDKINRIKPENAAAVSDGLVIGVAVPNGNSAANGDISENSPSTVQPFTTLILDLSLVSFIDTMGVKALEFVVNKYKGVGVSVFLSCVSENCLDTLQKSGFMGKHGALVFLTVDTVLEHLNE